MSRNIAPNKKARGFAVAAVMFFSLSIWFAFIGIYLYKAMINFKPLPGAVQEGDMVSALLMEAMFGAAIISLIISFFSLLLYFLNRYRSKNAPVT